MLNTILTAAAFPNTFSQFLSHHSGGHSWAFAAFRRLGANCRFACMEQKSIFEFIRSNPFSWHSRLVPRQWSRKVLNIAFPKEMNKFISWSCQDLISEVKNQAWMKHGIQCHAVLKHGCFSVKLKTLGTLGHRTK